MDLEPTPILFNNSGIAVSISLSDGGIITEPSIVFLDDGSVTILIFKLTW
jgi:hypothetical protein